MDGRLAFQELNQTAISAELTKESWRLTNSTSIGDAISEAMRIARSGRHGPVHLAIPEDMLIEPAQPSLFSQADMPEDSSFDISAPDLNVILRAIDDFEKPLMITGATVAPNRHHDVIRQISDTHHIPVISLTSPRGLRDPMLGKITDILHAADGIILIDKAPDFTLGFGAQISCHMQKLWHAPPNPIPSPFAIRFSIKWSGAVLLILYCLCRL